MGDFFQSREWMYKRLKRSDHSLCEKFIEGVNTFISFACNQAFSLECGKLFCPCKKCKNQKYRDVDKVTKHLMLKGFTENYYLWTHHGENWQYNDGEACSYGNFKTCSYGNFRYSIFEIIIIFLPKRYNTLAEYF